MKALEPDPLVPRVLERGMTITLLGPVAGSAIMFVIMLFIEGMWRDVLADFGSLWQAILFYLIFGWPSGVLPALVSAIAWLGVERHVDGPPARCLLAVTIGALCGATLIWPFIWLIAGRYAPDFGFALPGAVAGAGALLATARPWRVKC